MRCEVAGCPNIGTTEMDNGLVLCEGHAATGVFMPEFDEPQQQDFACECSTCHARRKAAAAAYVAERGLDMTKTAG